MSGAEKQWVAEKLGIKYRNLRFYETGEREPTIDGLLKIADFFDVSLDYLTGRSDDPRRDSAGRGGVAGDDYDE